MTDIATQFISTLWKKITELSGNYFTPPQQDNINKKENMLPKDMWALIAHKMPVEDLVQFKKTTKLLNDVSSAELLHQLCSMDKTPPTVLSEKEPALFLKQAISRIYTKQQKEIDYLYQYHFGAIVVHGLLFNPNIRSFETLVLRHEKLEEMNYKLVTNVMDLKSNRLDLKNRRITRLPDKLFQTQPEFWQNLFYLNLEGSLFGSLDFQAYCPSLATLECPNSGIAYLNLDDVCNLQMLDVKNNNLSEIILKKHPHFRGLNCATNPISHLDLSENRDIFTHLICNDTMIEKLDLANFTKLGTLKIDNMPLTDLNLTGAHPQAINDYRELEITLLFEKLKTATPAQKEDIIKTRLGEDYTPENCEKYGYNDNLSAVLENRSPDYLPSGLLSDGIQSEEENQTKLNNQAYIKHKKKPLA